ncbi:MAG: sigma-54 dependent transcriptional regulator [Archangium sp.]|nr:sigma-54 dependent transcriptional regulator [Archangium sp.]
MSKANDRILVLDDDAGVVSYLVEVLSAAGFTCIGESDPKRALQRAQQPDVALVVSDVEMPELRGPALLAALHAERPEVPVVLMTAFGSVDLAVSCMRAGAADFVTKPFKAEALVHAIQRVLRERALVKEVKRLKSAATAAVSARGLVAKSDAMKRVLDLAERAAKAETPVLLTGESGTGKSAVAQFIHRASGRSGSFVELNCASLPSNLVESELFGVRKGAFTDAREDRPGLFVEAEAGTLFLDEIGELPLESQPKLLAAVETRKIRAVGSSKQTTVDARLIAATNRSLEDALRNHQFRPDLYYRLNVIRIEIPPLRERREDIVPLLDAYLPQVSKRAGRDVWEIEQDAMSWLQSQYWAGNVRELLNLVERAVTLSTGGALKVESFERPSTSPTGGDPLAAAVSERWPLERLELAYVRRMLAEVGGNKAEAARVLGIDRRTLYAKLAEVPEKD